MRFGLVLDPAWPAEIAVAAETAGIELLWVESSTPAGEALVDAASLGAVTTSARVAVVVPVGIHPVALAEQIAVVDQILGGRVVLVLRCATDDEASMLDETISVLVEATASRPFRHRGDRWTIPGEPDDTTGRTGGRIVVTPTPAQLELPLWLVGTAGRERAAARGLPYVQTGVPVSCDAATRVRPALVRGRPDVASLRAAQAAWGLDLTVIAVGDGPVDEHIKWIARELRPRVQLDHLPPGTEDFWATEPPAPPGERPSSAAVRLPPVVSRYFDCANRAAWETMATLFTDDAELIAVGARARRGRDDVAAFYPKTTAAWARTVDTPRRCTQQGSTVVVEIEFSGIDRRGRELRFDAVDVFDLVGDRIRRVSIWYDIAAVRNFVAGG